MLPDSMIIPFVKLHGTGNDFVVLDAIAHSLSHDFDFGAAALAMCARRFGIGGDGLLLLDHPDHAARSAGATIRMRMWNPDSTEDMCGNGLRCIARLAHERGYVPGSKTGDAFIVQTLAGLRRAAMRDDGSVRVAMGQPSFVPQEIPTLVREPIEYSLEVGGAAIPHVTTLSTGSTHTVIFRDAAIGETEFTRLSPLIEEHACFPERTSIMWAHVIGPDEVQLRIWERGVGETLACGTGACATAVAAQVTGRCGEKVTVRSRGGALHIRWKPQRDIEMTGATQIVYEGEYSLLPNDSDVSSKNKK
jgi:diaminopimelate epimerase